MEKLYTPFFKSFIKDYVAPARLLIFAALFFPVAALGQLPTEFQKVELVSGLKNSVNFEFAPDGRVFILDRYGKITIYKPDSQTTVAAGELDVFHNLEDGLLGIAFDPQFLSNQYVYIHYSPSSAIVNRVSRFRMNGDQLDMSSEIVVLEWPTQRECCFHAAGDMDFDSRGNLYIATGDNSNHSTYATLDETNPNYSSENTSSNTNDLRGKILRIKPNTNGTYSIPEGNLFPNGVGGRAEIYVMGARNPFKIFVDKQNTDWLFWGEVGPDANVKSNKGPEGLDEINLTKKAGNYGWPYFSGKNEPYLNTYSNPDFYYDPNNPVNLSKWNTGAKYLPPAVPSWLEFFHQCYLAGPRYYFDPSIANPKKLPSVFHEAFFYYDFNKSKVWVVKMDSDGNFLSSEQLAGNIITGAGFIDLKIGPDGQLYILEYGTGCCATNAGGGKLVRVDYTGVDPNRVPQVKASADKTSGSLPLTVNFSGEGTIDPDGDALVYEWDFQSNGTVDSNSKNASFTYTQKGTFDARLRVKDTKGGINSQSVKIYAGNNAATFTFASPPDGGLMSWGDNINYNIKVDDREDGSTANGSISCSQLNLVPSFGHLNHFHDGLAIHKCEGTFYLDPAGHNTEDNIYMVFNTNYTDADGLTSFGQVRVFPKVAEAEYYDGESRTHTIDNTDGLGGGSKSVRALSHNAYLMFGGRNLQNINSVSYRVASVLGGTIELRADSPTGTLLSTVTVPVTGGLNNWETINAALTNPGGKHDLYFVFKNKSGDVNLFDLNYIEFKGAGSSTDNTPPEIISLEVISGNQLSVKFSDLLKKSSAEQLSNYSVNNSVSISSAVLQDDMRTVVLSISSLTADVSYSLTVHNIENQSGIRMNQSLTESFTFQGPLVRINAGGPALSVNGSSWEQNQHNSGGRVYSASSLAIANTTSDEIYLSEMYGDFTYNIPVPQSGLYKVALHFAEIYHGIKNTAGVGTRVFNVEVEGGQYSLANYDIIAKAGAPATAVVERTGSINVQDGYLTLKFTTIKDNAKISAIEVTAAGEQGLEPSITILSPANGANVSLPFNVSFEVKNWQVGNGTQHVHKIVDGAAGEGVYSTAPLAFNSLSTGSHTIKLALANADHTQSEYFDQIQVNVLEEGACPDKPFPMEWAEKVIGTSVAYRSPYVFAQDLDGDGYKDLVTGGWWYKNPGTPTGSWVKKTIGAPMNNMSLIHDFDHDGDYDIFGTQGSYISSAMAWAENDGKGNFKIHTNIPAGTSTYQETFMAGAVIGNFNGVANTQIAVVWNGAESVNSPVQMLTVPADPVNQAWTIASISPDSYGEAISAGDIDGDGDLDLFQGGNWLRNNGNGSWTTFSTGITLPTHFDRNALADLDGDGRPDGIVNQIGTNQEISWFQPPADPTKPWTRKTIGRNVDGALSLDLVDIDGDGDLDVLTGEWKNAHRLLAFENDLCNSGTWIEHVLHPGGTMDHHDGAQAADMDNDGDLDILSMGWDQRIPRVYYNNSTVTAENSPPVVANPILNQQLTPGTAYSFTFPANTFSDQDGDVLSYAAGLSNGSWLPSWLNFNAATRTFSGTPAASDVGIFNIRVTASDGKGGSVQDVFDLSVQGTGGTTSAIRLNAGGGSFTTGSGNVFAADQHFSSSKTYSYTTGISNTTDDALYQTERYGPNFSYSIPVPSGTYTVKLHFAEAFFTVSGKRVFNVNVEGSPFLTNYDIYADAGSATAVVKQLEVSVTDGTLNLSFTGTVENAKINAIEISGVSKPVNQPPVANAGADQSITLPANSVTLNGSGTDSDGTISAYSWTQLSGPSGAAFSSKTVSNPALSGLIAGTYVLALSVTDDKGAVSSPDRVSIIVNPASGGTTTAYRFNSGGVQVENSMGTFAADNHFSGGKTYTKAVAIAGTTDDAIYQTERSSSVDLGTLSYNFPLSNGKYNVVLHFAEIYWSASGERIFDVSIEGVKVLDNYDIFRKAGANTATTETFLVDVADGTLNLYMSSLASDGGVNRPKVSAIEIIPAPASANINVANSADSRPAGLPVPPEEKIAISAFPNPFNDVINLRIQAAEPQEFIIGVYDLMGRRIFERSFTPQSPQAEVLAIDLSDVPNQKGSLLLIMTENKECTFKRVVKVIRGL